MSITLYQEQIPFSNKRLDKPISGGSVYTNPIIAPFAFDFTTHVNTLETVIYIRNDSQELYYENVVVSLMKAGGGAPITGTLLTDATRGDCLSINGELAPIGYSDGIAMDLTTQVDLLLKYEGGCIPIFEYRDTDSTLYETDSMVNVSFSYGYNELNEPDWSRAMPVLVIPNIGTNISPDTAYHPVRMRVVWKSRSPLLTVRDYYIDVSYQNELVVGMQ